MTSGAPVVLLVTLQAHAGSRDRLRDELAVLSTMSRADPGCIRYDVLEEAESPDRFVLYEEWLDDGALADHNRRPHVQRFVEMSPSLLEAPMRVLRLRRAA